MSVDGNNGYWMRGCNVQKLGLEISVNFESIFLRFCQILF